MKQIGRYAIAIALALLGLGIALALYPQLPAQVPVHRNARGVIDGWMPKDVGAFIQPVIALGVVGLLIVFEPEESRDRQVGAFHWGYPLFVTMLSAFMLCVTILMLRAALGTHLRISTDIVAAMGILFAAFGSNLGRIPQNRRVGIRLPWTLSSPEVWARTHRFAAVLFVLTGVGTAAFVLITGRPSSAAYGVAALVAAALATCVYSYVLARRLKQGEA